MSEASPGKKPPLSGGFVAVIVFKFLKCAGFLLLGATVLHIAHVSRRDPTMQLAEMLGVNTHRFGVEKLQEIYGEFTPGQVEALGLAALSVGLVFGAEGAFLTARLWWATYFTIALTALGIPVEILEIAKRPHHVRGYALFAVNLAILTYVWRKRNEFRITPSPGDGRWPG